MVYVLTNRLNS